MAAARRTTEQLRGDRPIRGHNGQTGEGSGAARKGNERGQGGGDGPSSAGSSRCSEKKKSVRALSALRDFEMNPVCEQIFVYFPFCVIYF